jgi:hypothetical protein
MLQTLEMLPISYRSQAASFWLLIEETAQVAGFKVIYHFREIRSSRLCSRSRAAAIESLPLQLPLSLRMNASLIGCRINLLSSLRMAMRVPALIPSFSRKAAGMTIWPFELTTLKMSSIWLTLYMYAPACWLYVATMW